jgi:heptaprenylglyceryl phosphate synthase
MIRSVAGELDIPLMVGGGIRKPAEAAGKVRAGARFVVTSTVLEQESRLSTKGLDTMRAFATAVHEG